jgi:formate dehydrogenase iron-sulfur subunit
MELDRRDFLKLSGTALAGEVLVVPASATAQASSGEQLAILFDSSKCVGCRACQMACKTWNKLPPESEDTHVLPAEAATGSELYDAPLGLSPDTWTLIKLRKDTDTDWNFMNYQCMHCTDAACVVVCPSGALTKDERGFVRYDQAKCIGCGYCTQFCPFDVPQMRDEETFVGGSVITKCTFCQDRIDSGLGGPFCATNCPTEALVWGSREKLLASAKERVTTLQDEGKTTAMLYGESEAAGLHRLTILLGNPAQYKLPTEFPSVTVAQLWQYAIQVIGGVIAAAGILGVILAFLVSRRNIRMEEVD